MKIVIKFGCLAGVGLGVAGMFALGGSALAKDEWTLDNARAAAAKGDPRAEYFLARRYAHGQGVARDYSGAVEYLVQSASQGYAPAQAGLGSCYAHGEGVKEDLSKAIQWYHKAAAQGDALAEYCLGYACAHGQGEPKDMGQAIKWWQAAAAQGQIYAESALGEFYFHGEGPHDTNINYAVSAKWLLKAAEQNDKEVMCDLASLYQNGWGVKQDLPEALKWYSRGAQLGNSIAQYRLGLMYEEGIDGLPHDKVQAYKWFMLSAEQGNPEAKHDMREYKFHHALTLDEEAEAQRMVAEFHAGAQTNRPARMQDDSED